MITETPKEHYENLAKKKKAEMKKNQSLKQTLIGEINKQHNTKSFKVLNSNQIADINEENDVFKIARNKIKIEQSI